jgi:bis(5'-nucleosidyl)-tetraphosphatase
VLLFRKAPELEFLLMHHPSRLDLPKGHIQVGEDEVGCAMRELVEETGLPPELVRLEPDFRFQTTYRYSRYNGLQIEKTVVIFLGWLEKNAEIVTSEHIGFEWQPWNPPHRLQNHTIDPLLHEVEIFFGNTENNPAVSAQQS